MELNIVLEAKRIFRNGIKISQFSPWATPHKWRHSFATHHFQNGVNLKYLQSLFDNNSLQIE